MVKKSYKERNFRNTHLEKYRSVVGSRALYFYNSQVTYAKEKKPCTSTLEHFLIRESVMISPNALEVRLHKEISTETKLQ